MQLIRIDQGATLLELIITLVIVSSTVIFISLIFPKSAAVITNVRQHTLATNFAAARIQEIKQQTYAHIGLTPRSSFLATVPAANNALYPAFGCDCNLEDLSAARFTKANYIDSGVTYVLNECINLMTASATNAYCADSTSQGADKGLKRIRVRVSWTSASGRNQYFSDTESMVTR